MLFRQVRRPTQNLYMYNWECTYVQVVFLSQHRNIPNIYRQPHNVCLQVFFSYEVSYVIKKQLTSIYHICMWLEITIKYGFRKWMSVNVAKFIFKPFSPNSGPRFKIHFPKVEFGGICFGVPVQLHEGFSICSSHQMYWFGHFDPDFWTISFRLHPHFPTPCPLPTPNIPRAHNFNKVTIPKIWKGSWLCSLHVLSTCFQR